ncbi:MAG: rubrerythrin [Clostridia bacterium]|nr:rubrerythrin [Clostridia bacterium]MDD4799015.1 rubrerythrin [Clostridia bacterium]
MENNHQIDITTRDRLLRAWRNSTEMVRDFNKYSKEIEDDNQTAEVFAQFAVDEGLHAAKFREILHQYQDQ